MNQYPKSQSTTDYADEAMLSSLSNSKPLTPSCGQSTKVPLCPQEGEHKATGSYNPVCQPDRGKTMTYISTDATECGSLQSSNLHNRKQQQPSLAPCSDDPTNWPFLGKTMFKENIHSNLEARVSLGPIVSEGQSPQRSTNVAKIRGSTKCETWVAALAVICLMAVGLVRLRMTEKVMEEKVIELEELKSKVNMMEQQIIDTEHFKSRVNMMEQQIIDTEHFKSRVNMMEQQIIDTEHFKSRVSMLERLVHRMSEANSELRIQNTFKTKTAAPMSTMKFPKELHRFPDFTGTTNQPASRGGGLSRAKRDASEQRNGPVKGVMRSILNCYCKTKSGKGTSRQLEFVQFLAVFNGSPLDQHISTMTPEFNGDPNAVEIEGDWPYILRIGGVITYIRQGSPLHIYEAYKPQPVDTSTVLVENSNVSSTFTVKISGLYAVHVDITISDENHRNKQYIGVYVNGLVVLGCLNGGLWSSENLKDSPVTRICNINGVLNLKESDRIQLKTMEAHITILVDPKKFNSVFTMVLLHKSSTSGAEAGRGYICPWAPD